MAQLRESSTGGSATGETSSGGGRSGVITNVLATVGELARVVSNGLWNCHCSVPTAGMLLMILFLVYPRVRFNRVARFVLGE